MNRLGLLLCFFSYFLFSQKVSFPSEIVVEYSGEMKLGENYKKSENFILLGNANSYYFASEQNYKNDTGKFSDDDNVVNTTSISSYFRDRVTKTDVFYTFSKVTDSKIKYTEKPSLKWVLYGDKKIINGVECQLATTNKYGRRWYAYFSKKYPLSIGPYKFFGLPGLIFEIYDTRQDYHFTLQSIKNIRENFQLNLDGYKSYTKENYLKARNNLEFSTAIFPAASVQQLNEIEKLLEKKKKMYNNPIELKPYE